VPGLNGKTIAITRNEQDAREFIKLVAGQGGKAIALPTTEIVPKGPEATKDFLEKLEKKKYDYCAFMSPHAVDILFDRGREPALALRSTAVIAVGPKTRESLMRQGVQVRLMPEKFSSAGLVELLSSMGAKKKKIIIPRSGAADEFATKALKDLGMQVDEVLLYTVRTASASLAWIEFPELLAQKQVDALIFTSASNVRSFFQMMDRLQAGDLKLDDLTKVISIGPFTSRELKWKEVKYVEAEEHTVEGALDLARSVL